jgi:hypothetical protein
MTKKRARSKTQLDDGKKLARELYNWSIRELENPDPTEREQLTGKYPSLSKAQIEDVLRQVVEAKQVHQERVGWQAIPHDIAVLVLVLLTAITDLQTAVIACIAILVLLESVFQFTFNRKLYRPLSTLVWLTYPAYIAFGYLLYRMGYSILWIVVGTLLASLGTYVLGALSRLPIRLILESRAKGREEGLQKREGVGDRDQS